MTGLLSRPRLLLAASLFALSCTAAQAQDRIQLMTAPVGSIVHTVGSSIAGVVSQKTGKTILATSVAGPQVAVPQVNAGRAEYTLINAFDAYEAFNGNEPDYKSENRNLRLVSVGFTNRIGALVAADSDIKTPQDMKGKRFASTYSGHRTCAKLSQAVLANAGMTLQDVKEVPVAHSTPGVQALGEGRVDIASCAAVGAPVTREVNAQKKVRFLPFDASPEAVKRAKEVFPAGTVSVAKAGSVDGIIDDTPIWTYPFYLLAGKHVTDDQVYEMTKTIHQNLATLREQQRVFNTWTEKGMVSDDINVPYHPGAIRYYKEAGLWTEQAQAAQDKLMAQAK